MRFSTQVAERMKTMLVRDKMGVSDGFLQVFKGELTRLVGDYFKIDRPIDVKIDLLDNGKYEVEMDFSASATKGFSTTRDMK
jgi:hypothetical protein